MRELLARTQEAAATIGARLLVPVDRRQVLVAICGHLAAEAHVEKHRLAELLSQAELSGDPPLVLLTLLGKEPGPWDY